MNIFRKPSERNIILDAFKRIGLLINPHVYRHDKGEGIAPDDGETYGEYAVFNNNYSNLICKLYFDDRGKLAATKFPKPEPKVEKKEVKVGMIAKINLGFMVMELPIHDIKVIRDKTWYLLYWRESDGAMPVWKSSAEVMSIDMDSNPLSSKELYDSISYPGCLDQPKKNKSRWEIRAAAIEAYTPGMLE